MILELFYGFCFLSGIFYCGQATLVHGQLSPCAYDDRQHVSHLHHCLNHVKQKAADPKLFWFGEAWKDSCMDHKRAHHNEVNCYNPPELQSYLSLGSRLFRVRTFDALYLRNLEIFPEVVFTSAPGSYTGCDHTFLVEESVDVFAFPEMDVVVPFYVRFEPKISWPEMSPDSFFTVAIVDTGFGTLQYLAHNFPHKTNVLRNYTGPLNFRPDANPVVILVWRQPRGFQSTLNLENALKTDDNEALFNVQRFILDNGYQQSLIGLNWINVGTDAYAIEKQRSNNLIDNCPSLLRQKLFTSLHRPVFEFLHRSSFARIDSWTSLTFRSEDISFQVCCQVFAYDQETVSADPLGDKELTPVLLRKPPSLSVSNSIQGGEIYKYRRMSRDFVAVLDKSLYTVLLVDADEVDFGLGSASRPLALWLVSNIPGSALNGFTEGRGGRTDLKYLMPRPSDDRVHRIVFMLFHQDDGEVRQHNAEHFSPKSCPREWKHRCRFNAEELMARHSLSLKSISWFLTQKDPFATMEDIRWGEREDIACRKLSNFHQSVLVRLDCDKKSAAVSPDMLREGKSPPTSTSTVIHQTQRTKLLVTTSLILSIFICKYNS